jgi:hypothetical protein
MLEILSRERSRRRYVTSFAILVRLREEEEWSSNSRLSHDSSKATTMLHKIYSNQPRKYRYCSYGGSAPI